MDYSKIFGEGWAQELTPVEKTGDGLFCTGQNGVDGVFTPSTGRCSAA